MIVRLKDVIARCIERMRQGACATCDNRRVCPAGRLTNALAPPSGGARRQNLVAFLAFVERLLRPQAAASPCFAREVEEALSPLLASGEATVSRVAATLGISRQTLHRRLQAENNSYQKLLAAKRRQLAIRYLVVERTPVKVVAWRLGFSSPAAFSRAFKRWTGSSPRAFEV